MSATIVTNTDSGLAKQDKVTKQTEMSGNNIIKKTIQMSETMKMYPRPVRK